MYNVKGFDLCYKTGYINGYTLYATKSIGQLQVELDVAWYCETNDTELSYGNRMWFLGYMEGIEYAIYLKRMNKQLPLTWKEKIVRDVKLNGKASIV